jgi:hypothetical protein
MHLGSLLDEDPVLPVKVLLSYQSFLQEDVAQRQVKQIAYQI